jgi:hypothetical protein
VVSGVVPSIWLYPFWEGTPVRGATLAWQGTTPRAKDGNVESYLWKQDRNAG